MRLIDADSLKEKLCILGEHRVERLVEKEPTVDVLDKIRAEIYEEFMTIDGGVHDESAIKCMQIIGKYR